MSLDSLHPSRQVANVCVNRQCWVCFASTEDDRAAEWVRPCRCKGSTKWVHTTCLKRWVEEKQKGHRGTKVYCPQCCAEYNIIYPPLDFCLNILDIIDKMVNLVCPFVAGGLLVGSVYWTAVTYAAVSVMQVLGYNEGLVVMEQAEPLLLLLGLPIIPAVLILGKMVRWEEFVLRLWRKHSPNISLLQATTTGLHNQSRDVWNSSDVVEIPPMYQSLSVTRVLCGALIFPTMSSLCGKLFYPVRGNLLRSILGGITFLFVKGVLKLYYLQCMYVRQDQCCIRNVPDESDDDEQ